MNRPVAVCIVFFGTILAVLTEAASAGPPPARLPMALPEEIGINSKKLAEIDGAIAEAMSDHCLPGCVVMVCRRGKVALVKAYGNRQVSPERISMTSDTVFDLASLTKPIATATSVMMLAERGNLCLHDPVGKAIPDFRQNGKEKITLFQLLTHQGGLVADNSLGDYRDGPAKSWERIWAIKPVAAAGEKFIYSDVGFLVLGELVHRVCGQDLRTFTRQNIFVPLGMADTGYLPDEDLRRRAAPTEQRNGRWMQGEVHDPRAYALGGVSGHAGLFSTAADLAVFAQMMLDGGQYCGVRILSRNSVAEMTRPCEVPGGLRGLGWDIKSAYSSNRSPAYSTQAFGHGGFTGTSLWIDPPRQLIVIFLSNRLHPDGKGKVNPLAARIGTIAVEAIEDHVAGSTDGAVKPNSNARVLTGIDVLQRDRYASLVGRHVGLITNHTGVNHQGLGTGRLVQQAAGVELVALFSPEHGLEGKLDVGRIADSRDPATGLTVYSLYGKNRKPTAETLKGIDTIVFDIQDIGTRFYTYISTLGYAMETAAEHKLRFVVLDRPNPVDGIDVAGPLLDAGRESFTAFFRLPVRHGMTVGELARMFNAELHLGLALRIIRMEGWQRHDFYDATGLEWVNPSPNMRSLTEALLYPGIGLLETTNLSVGRGTATPFEVIGAPWLDGSRLAAALAEKALSGVAFAPITFTPESSKFAGQRCQGVRIAITDRKTFEPVGTGLEIAHELRRLYAETWNAEAYGRLLGNQRVLDALKTGKSVAAMRSLYEDELQEFRRTRSQYLLYEP